MATITSLGIGSGLDLNGLLDQLRDAERGKLEPITQQKASFEARISAFGKLNGALSTFQSAAAKLNDTKLYESVSSKVEGTSVTAAANAEATPGRYDVEVINLARASSVATQGVADPDVALSADAGSVGFTLGNGEVRTLDVPAGATLSEVRDIVNQAGIEVSASLVFDGTNHRLAFSSNETGTDAAIDTLTFGGGLNGVLAEDAATRVVGTDASLTVNGIAITSQSNQVEGAIQGVTLEVGEEGTSTVTVERNNRGVREAVSGFVKAYNDLKGITGQLTRFDAESGEAGELLGDSTLRSVESRLRGVLGGGVDEGQFRMLSDVGISLQRDGTLELDQARLDEIVVNDRQALTDFFAGTSDTGGMAGRLDESLGRMLGDTGLLGNATRGLETRIGSLDDRFERMERSVERTMDRYRQQFGQLDSMISSMNQTSAYLTQQFDMMNTQLGRE